MKELALHMLDVAENGVRAGAGEISILLKKTGPGDEFLLRIQDDGKGMAADELEKALDPFYSTRSTRKIGMGLPLLRQHAEMTGGSVQIQSDPGKGTCVDALFRLSHPDCQPLGDLAGSWLLLASGNPKIDWVLTCETDKGKFSISSPEIMQGLELEELSGHELLSSLKRLIRNNMEELGLEGNDISSLR